MALCEWQKLSLIWNNSVEAFKKDPNQIFSGVKATVSKLDIQDSRAIWGLLNFYGGKCTLDFDHTCTHLIVGRPEGVCIFTKYLSFFKV